MSNRWAVPIALLMAGLVAWVGYLRNAPVNPRQDTKTEKHFSVKSADKILETLVGDGIPHPAGSEQNKIVRQRIINFFQDNDIQVELQETSNEYWKTKSTIPLVNIIATIPGTKSTGKIMLASHYDSVPGGPGACDDGIGTAIVMEIARYFKNSEQPRNDLVFLISDGEEFGLLGAEKFVDDHRLAKEIDVVINLESRGTTGPSLMFETGTQNLWSIQTFAAVSQRPHSSSLFFEIYKALPNDTDFSRFRELDMQGFNFGIIGDVKNYHTPEDNFANVDRGSFQHHGDNAFGLMARLANADLQNRTEGQAVYFDLMGFKLFYWPAYLSIVLSSAILIFFVVVTYRKFSKKQFEAKRFLTFGLLFGAVILCLAGGCFLLNLGMLADDQFESPWPENPVPTHLVFWSIAVCLVSLFGMFVEDKKNYSWSIVWLTCSALSLAISFLTVGASYLFIVPALFAVVGTLLIDKNWLIGSSLGWLGVILMWLPIEFLFYDALGFRLNILLVLRITIVCSALFPILASTNKNSATVCCVASGVVATACLLLSRFT